MPKAWFKDESCSNINEDGHFNPPQFVTLENLKSSTRVECFEIDVDNLDNSDKYWNLREDRGYSYEDLCEISKELMKDEFDSKLKMFYTEHLHADEEIRLFLEGSGYFDVRDNEDKWIRIHASKGDLIILPAKIYHRFTLDKNNYAKVKRLFCGDPVWTAINRDHKKIEQINN